MAGQGRAPKPPDQRRNRHEPRRGEWVDLPALEAPILPELPKRARGTGRWSPRTVAAWEAWRADPSSSQYGPAEIAAVVELAFVMDDMVRSGSPTLVNAVRQRMDGLGLTAKGKRDLRWRAPTETAAQAAAERPKLAQVRRLHAVDAVVGRKD